MTMLSCRCYRRAMLSFVSKQLIALTFRIRLTDPIRSRTLRTHIVNSRIPGVRSFALRCCQLAFTKACGSVTCARNLGLVVCAGMMCSERDRQAKTERLFGAFVPVSCKRHAKTRQTP
jgi:hypothetical protein